MLPTNDNANIYLLCPFIIAREYVPDDGDIASHAGQPFLIATIPKAALGMVAEFSGEEPCSLCASKPQEGPAGPCKH